MDTSVSLMKPKARVQHSYNPEHDDELKLEIGDIIEVLKQEEEGWWEGNLNGRVGMFPSNFVELVESQENTEKVDESKDQTQFREIKGKKVQGVGLGNIFGGGPIRLRPTSVHVPATKKSEHIIDAPESKEEKTAVNSEIANKRDSDEIVVKRERSDRAVVRFSYVAENEDELSLEVGDLINVIDMTIEDTGWWKGEINGRVGVFPDNFVEILPTDEVKPKKPPPPSVPKNQKNETARPVTPPTSEKKSEPDVKNNIGLQNILDRKSELRSSHLNHVQPDRLAKKREPELPSPGDKSQIPSKKPALPPPVGRKPNQPLKHTDHSKVESKTPPVETKSAVEPKLSRITVTNEDTAERPGESVNLDAVESSEKLSHPTAHRARIPNRRPPSTALIISNDEEKTNEVHNDKQSAMTSSIEELKDEPVKETKKLITPATSPWSSTSSIIKRSSTDGPPARPPPKQESMENTGDAVTTGMQTVIEDLKKELHTFKASTVSKSVFNELKSDHEKLRREMETLKSSHTKRMLELMNEIDEEKKGRLNIQVEIERIKKLVFNSNV